MSLVSPHSYSFLSDGVGWSDIRQPAAVFAAIRLLGCRSEKSDSGSGSQGCWLPPLSNVRIL
jgi:hypothetical protein